MKSRVFKWAVCSPLVFCSLVFTQTPGTKEPALTLKRMEIKVPMAEAGAAGLQTVLVWPSTPGKHPLVLMTHGSEYSKGRNQKVGPGLMQPAAVWFARRGWVVAIVMRRGYGDSGGKMEKAHYGCNEADYSAMADENASDLVAVYEAVKKLPEVDASRMIATGNSAGGFASLALAAHAPSSLKAVINFSGGWHSLFFAGSCAKSGLVPEFRTMGASIHVPTLWLYAKNDSLFPPKYVALMHDAFTSTGGDAEMPLIGKTGEDGHYLFSEAVDVWTPLVEGFLEKHGLPWQDLAPEAHSQPIQLPENFPSEMRAAFIRWEKLGPNKAFAIGPDGGWGYSSGRKTLQIAKDEAMDRCRNPQCKIIAYDGK